MNARQLEALLESQSAGLWLSRRPPDDFGRRFESLRAHGLLPNARNHKSQPLSLLEIASATLCVVVSNPQYAGLAAKILMDLRPVGGNTKSFASAATFGEALQALFNSTDALESLLEVRVSESEIYKNGHCRAAITYRSPNGDLTAHYIGKLATSLLGVGAEKEFNPRQLISPMITETVIYHDLFRRITERLHNEARYQMLSSTEDDEADNEELTKAERAKRLGITAQSRFLNVGVDNQVTWPSEETVVSFEGKKLILRPKTKGYTTSIHVDLHGQRLSSEKALTLINRFLSVLTWCSDQFAVMQDGWSGSPVPVSVSRRDLAFSTAYQWFFDRKTPAAPEAKKAIAIYRDARNAEQNYLVSYAVLSYYKIIELKHKGSNPTRKWYRDNFDALKLDGTFATEVAAFMEACGNERPSEYLYSTCRVAVAHANTPYSSDPDDALELRRLHIAAVILRRLARRFIELELGVSDCVFDGT